MGIKSRLRENWGCIAVAVFILAVIWYVAYDGEDIYIPIHDNLDSVIAWLKMLKDNRLFWSHGEKLPFLGGLDRDFMPSEWKAYQWLYMLFPAFGAYVAGFLLKIILAVCGSMFLGKALLKGDTGRYKNRIILCGFLYGILPTYPPCSFSFTSLPFLLGVLWLLYEKESVKLYLALLGYPLFSDFAYFGIFICGYLLAFFLLDSIRKKKANKAMAGGLIMLIAGYVLTEYRLFYAMLFSGTETIRQSIVKNMWGRLSENSLVKKPKPKIQWISSL